MSDRNSLYELRRGVPYRVVACRTVWWRIVPYLSCHVKCARTVSSSSWLEAAGQSSRRVSVMALAATDQDWQEVATLTPPRASPRRFGFWSLWFLEWTIPLPTCYPSPHILATPLIYLFSLVWFSLGWYLHPPPWPRTNARYCPARRPPSNADAAPL